MLHERLDEFARVARDVGLLSDSAFDRLRKLTRKHPGQPSWVLAIAAHLVTPAAADPILAGMGKFYLICTRCGRRFPARHVPARTDKECPDCGVALVPCTRASWSFPVLDPDEIEKDALIGAQLGPYRIDAAVGGGGMGNIYRATELGTLHVWAVKILTPALLFGAEETHIRTFLTQAERIARLRHPNIVRVHAVEEHMGAFLVVMEYLEGGSLRQKIRRRGKPTPDQMLQIVLAAADALNFAHDHDMLHLDLKPDNILFAADGTVKLTDFSGPQDVRPDDDCARIGTWGTPSFMSPEQADRRHVDQRSDIYSLGLVWAAVAARKKPYPGVKSPDIRRLRAVEPCPLIAEVAELMPENRYRVLSRMCAFEPDDRYQTMQDCLTDLRSLVRD